MEGNYGNMCMSINPYNRFVESLEDIKDVSLRHADGIQKELGIPQTREDLLFQMKLAEERAQEEVERKKQELNLPVLFKNFADLSPGVLSGSTKANLETITLFCKKHPNIEAIRTQKKLSKPDFYLTCLSLLFLESKFTGAVCSLTEINIRNSLMPKKTPKTVIETDSLFSILTTLRFNNPETFPFYICAQFFIEALKKDATPFLDRWITYIRGHLKSEDEEIRTVAENLIFSYEISYQSKNFNKINNLVNGLFVQMAMELSQNHYLCMKDVTPLLYELTARQKAFALELVEQEIERPDISGFSQEQASLLEHAETLSYRSIQKETLRVVKHAILGLKTVNAHALFGWNDPFFAEPFWKIETLSWSSEEEKEVVVKKKKVKKSVPSSSRKIEKIDVEEDIKKEEIPFFPEPAFLKILRKATPPFKDHPRIAMWMQPNICAFGGYLALSKEEFEKQKFFHGFTRLVDKALHRELQFAFETEKGKGLIAQIYKDEKWMRGIIYYGIDKETGICYHRMFEEKTTETFTKNSLQETFNQADRDCQELFEIDSEISEAGDFEGDSFDYIKKNGVLLFKDARYNAQIYIIPRIETK